MMQAALTINMGVSQKEPRADIHVCIYIYMSTVICMYMHISISTYVS